MLNLQVSQKVLQELHGRAHEFGFTSPEEFACYILNEVLCAIRDKETPAGSGIVHEKNESQLRIHLEDLGYL